MSRSSSTTRMGCTGEAIEGLNSFRRGLQFVCINGQSHTEYGAAVRSTSDLKSPAMIGEQLTGHEQPEASSMSLGREIWFEQPLANCGRETTTVVGNLGDQP